MSRPTSHRGAAPDLPRLIYWRLRRTPARAPHVLAALGRAVVTAARHVRTRGPAVASVAIVQLERMGDIVAAEPISRHARERFPGARLCWVTLPAHAGLVASFPAVDRVVTVRCLTEWLALRRLLRFEAVWNLHINGYGCPLCGSTRADPGVPDAATYFDFGNHLEVMCRCAGVAPLTGSPRLRLPVAAGAAIDRLGLPARFVAVHANSIDPAREWPAEKWRRLIALLLAADPALSVVEVGLRRFAVPRDDGRQRSLCGRLTLPQTAALIGRASLFIGIDSGPAHLANAVGAPGVLMLGRYRGFARYMPFSGHYADGTRATVVRTHGPAGDIDVAEVFSAATARLAAWP